MPTHNTSPAPADTQNASHSLTPHTKPLTEQIVAAVADATDCSPRELPPLYEVVDPDALNHLFAPTYSEGSRTDGQVQFAYAGYEVVVYNTGDVNVNSLDAADEQ